jgi:ribosomal protein S18 acetylase RimI-like enzyme
MPAADASPTDLRPVEVSEQREALGLLLSGQPNPHAPAVRSFLEFSGDHELDLSRFWWGFDGRRPAAAVLIVPGVGKTAMLFSSPVASGGSVPLTGRLVGHGLAQTDPQQTKLVQSLLEPGQPLQRRALEAGGMRFLSDLAYMQRQGRRIEPRPRIDLDGDPLTPVRWSEDRRPLFRRAIVDSYTDTLDCPGLLGLRGIDDIIAGHMATGTFNASHWTVWVGPDERPAAVLLLAESSGGQGFELVYLGVCPHARRQGLAKRIMQIALDTTARGSREKRPGPLHLAVDDRNGPALRLYRGLGFRTTARKCALIHARR